MEPTNIIFMLAASAVLFVGIFIHHLIACRLATLAWRKEARIRDREYDARAEARSVTLWDDCRSQCEGASVTREH